MKNDLSIKIIHRLLLGFIFLGAGCLIDMFVETNTVRVREFAVTDPDLPAAFRGYRIAFLADIHYGPYFSTRRLVELVNQTNDLAPDLILLGGDYIGHGARYIDACFSILGRLKAPGGVWAVLGNHDHWAGAALCREALARNSLGLLDNESRWINRGGARIKIGGVGDLLCDIQDLSPTVSDASEGDFVILLSHNPDYAEKLATKKIDLLLAGHTHGGQVTAFGLYAPLLPVTTGQKYRSGLVETPRVKVIVSNGIGTITPPVRFGAPAEILLITLR